MDEEMRGLGMRLEVGAERKEASEKLSEVLGRFEEVSSRGIWIEHGTCLF